MKKINELAGRVRYVLIKGGIALINALPYPLAVSLGRCIGLLGWLADPFHRRAAEIQLRHCLGDRYRPSIVPKVFMHHGDILVDTIKYAYMDDEEIKERIIIEGKENLDKALSSNCLLYTSDAADDLLCVDLGGRRIIKKKKNTHTNSEKTSQ